MSNQPAQPPLGPTGHEWLGMDQPAPAGDDELCEAERAVQLELLRASELGGHLATLMFEYDRRGAENLGHSYDLAMVRDELAEAMVELDRRNEQRLAVEAVVQWWARWGELGLAHDDTIIDDVGRHALDALARAHEDGGQDR